MTKMIITLLSLLIVVALVACSPASGAGDVGGKVPESASLLDNDYENALPVLTQLLVGTFGLENGDLAVEAAQAAELLPLWKAYRSLSDSDSASSLELEAILDQIQGAMTTEQVRAIAEMQLTGAAMIALAEERGIEMAQGGNRNDLSPEQIETMQAQRSADGSVPGSKGGSGIPGAGDTTGTELSADEIATRQAQREGSGSTGVSPMFFDTLIDLLESKG